MKTEKEAFDWLIRELCDAWDEPVEKAIPDWILELAEKHGAQFTG